MGKILEAFARAVIEETERRMEKPKYETMFVQLQFENANEVLRIDIRTNCDIPNSMSTDEIVEQYMAFNYPGKSYGILQDYAKTVVLNEKDIWGLPSNCD